MEIILSYLHSGVSAIVPFIVLLGLLIFVHEMGHFLVAKFFGVRVEVFSLGFGKKLFSFKRGDTTYCISLIPLGGYVKMFGDELNADIPAEQKKYSFTHKPVAQRIGVVLAGPMMNFFFAIFIFFLVAMIGEQLKAPVLGDIANETAAYSAGFRSGDKIIRSGGLEIKTWDEFSQSLTRNHGQTLEVIVQREGADQTSTIQVSPKLTENPNILSLNDSIGDIDGLTNHSKSSVVGVRLNSVAATAGLMTGDIIKSIAGRPVKYFREIDNILVSLQGQPISLEIERYANIEVDKPQSIKISLPTGQFASMASIGIENSDLYLAKVMEASPAFTAGVKPGDKIVKVNTVEPKKWDDVLATVKSYKGDGIISLDVQRGSEVLHFDITPKLTNQMNSQGGEEKRYTVGIVPWALPAPTEVTVVKLLNPFSALLRGWNKTIEISQMTVVSFLRLAQMKISPKNIGGVISIGQAASETFKAGIAQYLQMMGIISINLFILNLLPVPVLDGGHLLFYTIEALRGAPLSMRKMEIAQQVGLVVLMSLMVFALFNDFTRVLSW